MRVPEPPEPTRRTHISTTAAACVLTGLSTYQQPRTPPPVDGITTTLPAPERRALRGPDRLTRCAVAVAPFPPKLNVRRPLWDLGRASQITATKGDHSAVRPNH